MTKVYVVRHGETDWNRQGRLQGATDVPLNEQGKAQAKACQQYFIENEAVAIFTSPLVRARVTAEIINEPFHMPLVLMPEFKERTFGEAEGMTYEERSKVYPRKNYPGQETFHHFIERLKTGLRMIEQQYPNDTVILVAHGAVIHNLFQIVENDDLFPQNARLSNGGVSTMYTKDGKWWLGKYNETHHLMS
jgi:uncharacterized phosphatase